MLILYNSNGAIIKVLNHGVPARQGTTDFEILACFGEDTTGFSDTARLTLKDPNGDAFETEILGNLDDEYEFHLVEGETADSVYPLVDGQTLPVYKIEDFTPEVFSMLGMYRGTIRITKNETEKVTGLIAIPVDEAVGPADSTITYDQYLELLNFINEKLSIKKGIKRVSELPSVDNSEAGQMVYDMETNKIYMCKIVSGSKEWGYIDLTNYDKVLKKVDGIKKITTTTGETDFINGQLAYLVNNNEQKILKWNAYISDFDILFDFKGIQKQVDDIIAKSDVVDIVGTKAQLNSYDTSKLNDNDIIKVLKDESQQNAISYYRYDKETDSFSLVGKLDPYYNKTEVDNKLANKQDTLVSGTNIKTINNQSILGSGNIDIQGGSGAVDSVNGKTGEVVLTAQDIALEGEEATIEDKFGEVDDDIQNVREVAEGKCKAYVISYEEIAPTTDEEAQELKKKDGTHFEDLADFTSYVSGATCANESFNSQDSSIRLFKMTPPTIRRYIITTDNVVVIISQLNFNEGDVIYVIETDVPDRWLSTSTASIYAYTLETSKVDLTNYVDLTSAQTISGVKTFSDWLQAYGGIKLSSTNKLLASGSYGIYTSETFYPNVDSSKDLGTSSLKWRDLYLSGKIDFIGLHNIQEYDGNIVIKHTVSNTDCFKIGTSVAETKDIQPISNNTYSLGTSTKAFKNLYLSGKLSDGTNEIVVADIASKDDLTDKADDDSVVHLTSNETISGVKTYQGNNVHNGVETFYNTVVSGKIRPNNDNASDLGENSKRYKDLYLSGTVKDANGNDLFVFKTMEAPSSSTLTDAQVNTIVNGCSIIGTFLGRQNVVFHRSYRINSSDYYYGVVEYYNTGSKQPIQSLYSISPSNVISITAQEPKPSGVYPIVHFSTVYAIGINGKIVPDYPSNTGNHTLKQLSGTLTWVQDGSVQTSAEATFSGSLTSNNEYQFTTPLTSLNITQLIVASGDAMPRWEINFVAGSNFTITSLGQDISWKYGEPTFETGEEYTIYIKGNYAYLI